MKKLLACVFLLLVSAISAQAIEKNDLIGCWEFAEGDTGLETAFYLHVDGTCSMIAQENGE